MCMFKSGIILKDRVFVPDYDHHTEMLEELKIKDTEKNAQNLFVRAELVPENGDVFTPVETWRFNVDQDIVPDWFVAEYERERMVAAVKEWAKSHIHIGKDNLVIDAGRNHYIKDCKNVVIKGSASISEVCGSASISKVCGSASISKVCGSASISYVYDSASISEVCGSASISYVCDSASISYVCGSASISYVCGSASISYVYDSASISYVCDSASISYVCGSASISYVCGSAMIASSPYSNWSNKDKVIISENATFKDNQTKTIWQSGDWKVQMVNTEEK